MSRCDRRLFLLALLSSLLVHGGLGLQLRNFPIGQLQPKLFSAAVHDPSRGVRAFRADEDLIVDEAETSPGVSSAPEQSRSDQHDLQETIRALLQQPDLLGELISESSSAEVDVSLPAQPSPQLPEAEQPRPLQVPVTPLDTRQLISLADPMIDLPEFIAATDGRISSPPQKQLAQGPGAAIGDAQLRAVDELTTSEAQPADDFVERSSRAFSGPANPASALSRHAPLGPTQNAHPTPDSAPALPPPILESPAFDIPNLDLNPAGVSLVQDDFEYALRTYRKSDREPGYFEVQIRPQQLDRRLPTMAKDVVYLVDTSESISANWIERIKMGVSAALDCLQSGDRFNLVLFKEGVQIFDPGGLTEASAENLTAARAFLTTARASGNTDVNRALGQMVALQVPADRVYQLILISDGLPTRGAIDPRRIIDLITRENDSVTSIFCVGVGERIDRRLLDFLAYGNKGVAVYAEGWLSAAGTIRDLAGRLRQPLIKDMIINVVGVDGEEVYPRAGRDLYRGDTFSVFGRYQRRRTFSILITGYNNHQQLDTTKVFRFHQAQRIGKQLAQNWAFWKLHHLNFQLIRFGQDHGLELQIKQLRNRYRLEQRR